METYRMELHEIKGLAASGLYRKPFTNPDIPIAQRLINVVYHLGFVEQVDPRDFCTPALLAELADIVDEEDYEYVRLAMRILPTKHFKNKDGEYWKVTDWLIVERYFFNLNKMSFPAFLMQEWRKEQVEEERAERAIYEFPNGTFSSIRQVADALGTKSPFVAAQYLKANGIVKNAEGFYVFATDPSAQDSHREVKLSTAHRILKALQEQSFTTVSDLAMHVEGSLAQTSRACSKLGIFKSPDTGLLTQSKGAQ